MSVAAPANRSFTGALQRSLLAAAVALGSTGVEASEGTVAASTPAVSQAQANAVLDRRLDIAASPTSRATRSVMLTVTSAGRRIVAAGERGLIVRSDDCGATWAQSQSPVSVTLTAMQFVNERRGWAVGHGGIVMLTDDGGATWRRQLDGRGIADLARAFARDAANSASTEESKRAVQDAERFASDGPDKPLFALHFWNPDKGIVVGAYGMALSTEDGGQHWRWISDRIPNPKGLHLYGLWADGEQILLAGEQGMVLRSSNGGKRFEVVSSPYAGSFFGAVEAHKESDTELFLFGLRGHAFKLTASNPSMQAVDVGSRASILSATRTDDGQVLMFDADGQILGLRAGQSRAQVIGSSTVGPVLGATPACGSKVALAGYRGVAVVEAGETAVAGLKESAR